MPRRKPLLRPRDSGSGCGLYVHLPFCDSRCGYCDFAVVTDKDERQNLYLECLLNEIRFWAFQELPAFETLYFGGGTPSRFREDLWSRLIRNLREHFEWRPLPPETTAEANPESFTPDLARFWKELGIQRVSLGIQSLDPFFLEILERVHSAEQAETALETVKETGFENWSADLIYGIPGQTVDRWLEDLEKVLIRNPPHLSFYNLILHPGLSVTRKAHETDDPAVEEKHATMFLKAVERLEISGYEVYEISNAALPGKECRHNRLYWEGGEWIGMGMSACGWFRFRYLKNPSSWQEYVNSWRDSISRRPWRVEKPSRETLLLDFTMLRLRTQRGFEVEELERLLGERVPQSFDRLRTDLIDQGLARDLPDRLALTPEGWLLHSEITDRVLGSLKK